MRTPKNMSICIQQFHEASQTGGEASPSTFGYNTARMQDSLVERAMAMARIGVWSCNLSDDRLTWSPVVYDLFGLPSDVVPERRQTVQMYTDESRVALERLRAQAIATRGTFTLDAQIIRATGDMRWMRITAEMNDNMRGEPVLHGLKQDITEEKSRSEELRRLAEKDALTGLASRTVYESSFLNRRGPALPLVPLGALVLFDLDDFKGINDRIGHSAGDSCLRAFADRLAAHFPDALLISRIGGDEFAVVIGAHVSRRSIEMQVTRFLGKVRAPISWRGHVFTVGATSGIAHSFDPFSYDPEELFVRADTALYAAKRSSRSSRSFRHN